MNKADFSNPSGALVKNQMNSYSFIPSKLPRKLLLAPSLTSLLVESHSNISVLSGIGETLPNPHLLIGSYMRAEAIESSRIEGTQASLLDLLQYEAGDKSIEPVGQVTIEEVKNYVRALEEGLKAINAGEKISKELFKKLHKILLKNVRSIGKNGEFRVLQNFIGIGNDIQLATYVPPPAKEVEPLLDDLIDFINNPPKEMPPLVQIALIHYQFEAIHPFTDGNGRIGRLLITLYLCEKNILSQPLIYLSEFFEKRKTEYYYRLLQVSQGSQWNEWLQFFLEAVNTQSKKSNKNIHELRKLSEDYNQRLLKINASHKSILLLSYLFARPGTSINEIAEVLGVTYMTAKSITKELVEAKILSEVTNKRRNKFYVATEIMDKLEQ